MLEVKINKGLHKDEYGYYLGTTSDVNGVIIVWYNKNGDIYNTYADNVKIINEGVTREYE